MLPADDPRRPTVQVANPLSEDQPSLRSTLLPGLFRTLARNIGRGFGLRGHEVRDVSVIPKLFADFVAQGESEIWNIQISDKVTAPVIRQTIKRGHGNM